MNRLNKRAQCGVERVPMGSPSTNSWVVAAVFTAACSHRASVIPVAQGQRPGPPSAAAPSSSPAALSYSGGPSGWPPQRACNAEEVGKATLLRNSAEGRGRTPAKAVGHGLECNALAEALRARAIDDLNAEVDWATGNGTLNRCGVRRKVLIEGRPAVQRAPSPRNFRTPGVDEADIVAQGGTFLYVATPEGVSVVDVSRPQKPVVESTLHVDGVPRALLVDRGRLVVWSSTTASREPFRECTYGYDCSPSGDGAGTIITVHDIASPATPIRRLELSGSYIGARRTGEHVHTVVYDKPKRPPTIWDPSETSGPSAAFAKAERMRQNGAKAVRDAPASDFLPSANDSGTAITSCDAAVPEGFFRGGLTSIVSFDASSVERAARTIVGSRSGFIYATPTALYLTGPFDEWTTSIHVFDLRRGKAGYLATGSVQGAVLGSHALDEYGGNLRVGSKDSSRPISYVSILGVDGDRLSSLAAVEIAEWEGMRAVHFAGERGYVVTFPEMARQRYSDPFFVLDLANPRSAKTIGKLEIPGFSTYLHPLDGTHFLGVGFDADLRRGTALGVNLEILDATEPDKPRRTHVLTLASSGTMSEAARDPLAFTYDAENRILVLPITECSGSRSAAPRTTFSGVRLFSVDPRFGIHQRGAVSEEIPKDQPCNARSWGHDVTTWHRSLIVKDVVLLVGDRQLQAIDLKMPYKAASTISF